MHQIVIDLVSMKKNGIIHLAVAAAMPTAPFCPFDAGQIRHARRVFGITSASTVQSARRCVARTCIAVFTRIDVTVATHKTGNDDNGRRASAGRR